MRIPRAVRAASVGAAIMTMALTTAVAAAGPVVVTDANAAEHGWTALHGNCAGPVASTGSQVMEEGPGTPPLGTGSREFRVGVDGNSFETFRLNEFNGTLLSDLDELNYSTYVDVPGSGGQAPYLILDVDTDGDGIADDQLFFEPVYQTGAYSGDPVPDQGEVVVGEWQDWDALVGGWWVFSELTFGPPLTTLDSYVEANPDARLAMTESGSVRIAVGCGEGAWNNFVGNADEFVIGAAGESFTYDFEVTFINEPGDTDACKDGGWESATDAEGNSFKNQGDCVSYLNSGKR